MSNKIIKFRVNFTNHLNDVINLNDFIVNVEQGSLIYESNKGYINLDFVTNKVYYDPLIIGDNIERIEVKWQINDDDIQTELFCIEGIEYLKEDNIKVYCKSKSFKYAKYNMQDEISGETLKEVISNIFTDLTINFDNFTDLAFQGGLDTTNKTGFELLDSLVDFYRFEYFYRQGILYIQDKRAIQKDDIPIFTFSEIEDIEEFNTSTDLFKKKIKKIEFNPNEEVIEQNLPSLKMDIKPDPQTTSPDNVLVYTDDNNNKYKLRPVKAQFIVYYSPITDNIPICNIDTELKEKTNVESYILNNEDFLRVTGHIKELLGIEGVESGYSYNIGDNLILFDEKINGEVKISYKSDVLVGEIANSEYPKNVSIKVNYLNRKIDYIHKIELNYYYPIPYDLALNTISDWGLSADVSINQEIQVSKYDNDSGAFVNLTTINSDEFGDFIFHIDNYGTYRFDITNQEPLFLDYFVNKKKLYMNEVNC